MYYAHNMFFPPLGLIFETSDQLVNEWSFFGKALIATSPIAFCLDFLASPLIGLCALKSGSLRLWMVDFTFFDVDWRFPRGVRFTC